MLEFGCECGGNVKKRQAKGKYFSFGEYGKIKLTKNCKVLICDSCGEYFEQGSDSSLSLALKDSLTDNFLEWLERIKFKYPSIRETDLAFYCNVAPATFSRSKNAKTGKVIPPYALLHLKLIWRDGPMGVQVLMDEALENEYAGSNSSGFSSPRVASAR